MRLLLCLVTANLTLSSAAAEQGSAMQQHPAALTHSEPAGPACDTGGGPAARLQRARTFASRTWDTAAMACAGDLYFMLAAPAPTDRALQVEAMSALNRLLHYLRLEAAADMMGAATVTAKRMEHAGRQLTDLAGPALATAADDAAVMINAAMAAMVTEGLYNAELLAAAIARDPAALDGRAQIVLGRQLFELPTILGGDPRKAIPILEDAVRVNPDDSQALYYLAAAYEQELFEKEAVATMARMLDADIVGTDQQMAADMLRLAAGLAMRLHAGDLSASLNAKRKALLAANPELNTRASVAAAGHGGEHPLDQDL